jgi:hypothetical protein
LTTFNQVVAAFREAERALAASDATVHATEAPTSAHLRVETPTHLAEFSAWEWGSHLHVVAADRKGEIVCEGDVRFDDPTGEALLTTAMRLIGISWSSIAALTDP